jgi:hypothetical protein
MEKETISRPKGENDNDVDNSLLCSFQKQLDLWNRNAAVKYLLLKEKLNWIQKAGTKI